MRRFQTTVLTVLGLALLSPTVFAQGVVTPRSAGGSVSSGSTVVGCTINSIVYIDASGNLACLPSSVVNGSVSTAGRSILTIQDTISGSSATSNFLNITGTFPATLSAQTNGLYFTFALDNDAQVQEGMQLNVTGTGPAAAAYGLVVNNSASGTTGVGVYGTNSGSQTVRYGGLFTLAGSNPSATSAALAANNGNVAADIFRAEDNGTAVFTIADGGAVTFASTVALNGQTNVASGQFIGIGSNSLWSALHANTALTPDASEVLTGSAANSVALAEFGDSAYDFQNPCTTGLGTSACTDPTLIIHSHNQDTGEFLSLAHDGKAGVIVGGNSTVLDGTIRLGGTVTLTESSATTILTIPVPNTTGSGGVINYTVNARDATNVQIRNGNVTYAAAATSGGTVTCNVFGVGPTTQAVGGDTTTPANPTQIQDGSGVGAITSGTLTYAWSVTTAANSCVLKLNAVSSLTQTTLQVHYTVISTGPAIVTGG